MRLAAVALGLLLAASAVRHGAAACPPPPDDAAVATMRDGPPRQEHMVARARRVEQLLTQDGFRALALGDSITQGWPADLLEGATGLPTLNAGIGGGGTQTVNWLLHDADWSHQHPQLVVLLIGTNNLRTAPACDIYWGIRSNVAAIHRLFPAARVAVTSVLPRGENMGEQDDKISAINASLQAAASQGGYRFVPAHDAFLCDRRTPCALMQPPNNVHLTRSGYEVLLQQLSAALRGGA